MPVRPLEIWGGLECTIARVHNGWRNQIEETGHKRRIEDLGAVRSLGIETLRYPVLMEAVAPDHPDHCDWRWSDERLGAMQSLGLRPIVGLLHHGSGPCYTSLLDPGLPGLLAAYAGKVARRYPWIERFTPVNEPLTTARFSALYGHWYPHATDYGSFLRALVIQCQAIVLAMRAIRQVIPMAQLVQTEDIGRTFGTPALRGQTTHENERRWLSLDLLCGRVDEQHPWFSIMRQHGIEEADLDIFRDGDAAPDVIGVNHYLTSERYLDEDLSRYPAHLRGHNGQQAFADAEAVRIEDLSKDRLGPAARLREVWSRYSRPIAITEVHHGCTREEQLRWLLEVWHAAQQVQAEGADVRGVTIWALFGAFDWNSLLTERKGFYEPGAFDVRAPAPRRTALATATRSLVEAGRFTHPVLQQQGWWQRSDRYYGSVSAEHIPDGVAGLRPLLILAGSRLAETFARVCAVRGLHCRVVSGHRVADLLGPEVPEKRCPWAVVDASFDGSAAPGSASVAAAAQEAKTLARACAIANLPFVTLSSDQVFDGMLERAYLETDLPNPDTPTGQLRLEHERLCLASHSKALIIRTGPIFDAWHPGSESGRSLGGAAGDRWSSKADTWVSPAYAPDLAHAVLDLLIDGETGLWHLANGGGSSLVEFDERLSDKTGPQSTSGGPVLAVRRNFALASCKGWPMPSLDDALSRYARDSRVAQRVNGVLAAE